MKNIKKGIRLLKNLQIKRLFRSLNIYLFGDLFIYLGWQKKYLNRPSYLISGNDSIRIIIYNNNRQKLKRTINSIKRQSYTYYQITIIEQLPYQLKIKEPYVIFLKSGDILTTNALNNLLYHVHDASCIYSDHDLKCRYIYRKPKFKPDFSIDFLRSYPYIHRAVMFKTTALYKKEISNIDDFIYQQLLLLYEKQETIVHVPHVLFHFNNEISITASLENVLMKHYQRMNLLAKVERKQNYFKTQYFHYNKKASIIIPNKDHKDDLKKCIDSIYKYTNPNLFEIIIIENNSETKEIFDYYEELKKIDNIRIVYWENIFNYSAINNFGASFAHYDQLLFLNNDVEILSNDWLDRMLGDISREDVGIVGTKLLYGNHTVQHGGVIVGTWGLAAHMFLGQKEDYQGYMYRAVVKQNLSAVTAACMMVKKSVFEEVNGFEEILKVAFNDIDLCLKVRTGQYLVMFDPDIVLIHHESLSRGSDEVSVEKKERFNSEVNFMKKKWKVFLEKGDPFYNKNLTLDRTDYMVK